METTALYGNSVRLLKTASEVPFPWETGGGHFPSRRTSAERVSREENEMDWHALSNNLLLRTAPSENRAAAAGKARHVVFEAGHEFWRRDDFLPYALFPLRGVISLQISLSATKQVEVAQVGWEGFAGAALFLFAQRAGTSAVAVTDGEAVAMPAPVFQRYVRNAGFLGAMKRYLQLLMLMQAHMSACNRVHGISEVCAGRLLLMHRTRLDTFVMTQDSFSRQLGVRRASISQGLARLQEQGAIGHDRRGRLTILNRGELEKFACSCYRVMKSEFNRVR